MTKEIPYIELAKEEKAHNGRSAMFWRILANRKRVLRKEIIAFAQRQREEGKIKTLILAEISA